MKWSPKLEIPNIFLLELWSLTGYSCFGGWSLNGRLLALVDDVLGKGFGNIEGEGWI